MVKIYKIKRQLELLKIWFKYGTRYIINGLTLDKVTTITF